MMRNIPNKNLQKHILHLAARAHRYRSWSAIRFIHIERYIVKKNGICRFAATQIKKIQKVQCVTVKI